MSRSTINNGDSGLVVRTALNAMFSELYVSNRGTVALAGDSRAANSFAAQAGSSAYSRIQYGQLASWLGLLSGGSFEFAPQYATALGGTTTTDLVNTQLPVLLANRASIGAVLCISGTNDFAAGIDIATSIANYTTFINALTAVGLPVIFVAEMPRGVASLSPTYILSTQQAQQHARQRAWLMREAPRLSPLVQVADVWSALRDRTQTTAASAYGQIDLSYANDGLHLNTLGNKRVADLVISALRRALPSQPFMFVDASDAYNATYNPTGNRIANGLMAGTAGNLNAVMTGTLATSYNASVSNFSGLSCVGSHVSTATGEWQQLVFSGTSGASTDPTFTLQTTISTILATAGLYGETAVEIEVDAGATGLRAIDPSLQRTYSGGTEIVQGGARNAAYDADIPEAYAGVIRSPALTIQGNETGNTSNIKFVFKESTAVALTVRLRNHQVNQRLAA